MTEHRPDPLKPDSRPALALHQFAIGPNAVAEALRHLRRFADTERCDPSPALAIIVEELVLNLAEHGDARTAALGFKRDAAGVRLTLVDDGTSFDPRDAVAPDAPPDRGGGAGLALVRAWSREITYGRKGDRNCLTLLVPFEAQP